MHDGFEMAKLFKFIVLFCKGKCMSSQLSKRSANLTKFRRKKHVVSFNAFIMREFKFKILLGSARHFDAVSEFSLTQRQTFSAQRLHLAIHRHCFEAASLHHITRCYMFS